MAARRSRNRRPDLNTAPVTVAVERLSHEGRGVAHVEGKTVFIDGALPGESVTFRYTRRHGQFDEGTALEILSHNPNRVTPRCPHAERCGGCSLQHLAPDAQIAHKQAVLLEMLAHQARVVPARVLPPIRGPLWGYRRRARLSVKYVHSRDDVLVGFREKSSQFIADLTRCETLIAEVGERIQDLRALVAGLSCAPDIPQLEIAAGDSAVAVLIRHMAPLVDTDLIRLRKFAEDTGLRVYSQSGGPDTLLRLDGEGAHLAYRVSDLDIEFHPGEFVQVNAAINSLIVPLALELLALTSTDTVLDLFCGLGNFTLPIAQQAQRVVGVEAEASLIASGTQNARRLALPNTHFVAANLFTQEGIAAIPSEPYTKLLLDPPRSGAAEFLATYDFRRIARVCYVSCNPVTLARDAAVLIKEHGYTLEAAGVLDMFPHTTHVESIALFTRR